jgi:hypothetical protein
MFLNGHHLQNTEALHSKVGCVLISSEFSVHLNDVFSFVINLLTFQSARDLIQGLSGEPA